MCCPTLLRCSHSRCLQGSRKEDDVFGGSCFWSWTVILCPYHLLPQGTGHPLAVMISFCLALMLVVCHQSHPCSHLWCTGCKPARPWDSMWFLSWLTRVRSNFIHLIMSIAVQKLPGHVMQHLHVEESTMLHFFYLQFLRWYRISWNKHLRTSE